MTTHTLTFSGASDDLIEVDGDFREEYSGERGMLVLGDGTIVSVEYTDSGLWSARVATSGDRAAIAEHFVATDADGSDYSDKLTLVGDDLLPVRFYDREPSPDELAIIAPTSIERVEVNVSDLLQFLGKWALPPYNTEDDAVRDATSEIDCAPIASAILEDLGNIIDLGSIA